MSSPFWFDKQSHVTYVVNVQRQNQPSCMSSNSQSTCFGSKGTRKYERVNMEKVAVAVAVAVAVFLSQFPAVLFSCSRFLNFADLTVLKPGTDLRSGSIFLNSAI